MKSFTQYSSYYDLIYKDKDYKSEAEYLKSIINHLDNNARTILEFGSGTGKLGLALESHGFEIIGIEKSPIMHKTAQKIGFNGILGDISNFELNRCFDAVLAIFHVISYLVVNEDIEKTFINASKHLNKNGLFIFDVWYMPAVLHQKPEIRIKKVQDDNTEIIRIATPITHYERNVVDVNYTFLVKDKLTNQRSEFEETHSMRYFSIPEISYIAKSTGFKLVKAEEFLTGNVPSPDTWGVCFVLKKV